MELRYHDSHLKKMIRVQPKVLSVFKVLRGHCLLASLDRFIGALDAVRSRKHGATGWLFARARSSPASASPRRVGSAAAPGTGVDLAVA